MTKTIKTILTVATMLMVNQFSFASATEDLFAALKASKDKDALTAIAAGADVKFVDPSWGTALYCASIDAGPEVIKALIDAKSELNWAHPANGYTALIGAAHWGNTEAIRLLLAAGADVKIKDKFGRAILAEAVTCGKLEVVKLLVDGGANANEKFLYFGQEQSPMSCLIPAYAPAQKVKNLAEIREKMQGAGFLFSEEFINAKETDFSPLGDIAAYLLSKGADQNQITKAWGSLLTYALIFNKPDIALALIEAKADNKLTARVKGSVSTFEATPLMLASAKGYNALVEALCKAGADTKVIGKQLKGEINSTYDYNIITTKTVNAISLAIDNGHTDTAEILKKYGAVMPK